VAVGPAAGTKRLLVLGAGPAQLGLLEAAAAREDVLVIACDRDPAAVGFPLADRRALVSTEDELAIEQLARAEHVDGIVAPGIDWPVAIAARVAAKLELPHPLPPPVAQLATSKQRQRIRLGEAGVAQPRWALVGKADTPDAAVAEVGLPCVVKAPDRQGQRGLSVVRDAEDVAAAVAAAREVSRSGTVLLEELVDGQEVTVVSFSRRGRFVPLAVTDRERGDVAFGVALAHVFPSPHAEEAAALAEAAADAIGLADGPAYTQIVCGADGPRVIELAARLGGGHDAELVEAATGAPLNAMAVAAALGEEPPLFEPHDAGGAVTRFLVPPVGELRAVEGVAEAQRMDGVARVRIYRAPGHRFEAFRVGADRAGALLAVGASRDEALVRADAAAAAIRFVVDPLQPEPGDRPR
jgi:biotin carboxylase